MINLLANGIISALLVISVSALAVEESQIQKSIDDSLKPKPEQDIPPIRKRKDSVTNQQNYDKNDAGVEIQEDIDPEKIDPKESK